MREYQNLLQRILDFGLENGGQKGAGPPITFDYQKPLILTRSCFPLPTLKLNPEIQDVRDFKFSDVEFVNYQHHSAIKAQVAV